MKVILLLAIVVFPLSILSSPAEAKPVNGFSIDLIHRDSPLSPLYNSSMTQREVLRNAAMRSISRHNRFHFTADGNKAETVIIPGSGDYLMKIFIGTPPVESFAIADTGSDLIWVQCLPCQQCYTQNAPIFNPHSSTTYEKISCDSESCNLLGMHACGATDQCRYYQSYGDKSVTAGDLASDTISFGSNAGQSRKTIFGCGHFNNGTFSSEGTGLVGLGGGPLSLVSQQGNETGHIFSYCLLPYTVRSTSKLKFGSESTMPVFGVVSTPLLSKSPSTFYYLSLEAVSIDDVKLQALQSLDIIIDSGTTLTKLQTSFYDNVETAVAEAVDDEALRYPPEPFKLCYRLAKTEDVPDITFHFSGADIHFQKGNTFRRVGLDTCLFMVPTDGKSIFGNVAQTNFKVEYDLRRKTVSFTPADCTKE